MRIPTPALAFSAALLFTATASAAEFDTKAYCARVAEMAGGSYTIERGCLDREARAKAAVDGRNLDPAIAAYCRKVGETAGGSYSIVQGCADGEEKAKAALAQRQTEARIQKHCGNVGRMAGGSQRITLSCIEREESARDNMKK